MRREVPLEGVLWTPTNRPVRSGLLDSAESWGELVLHSAGAGDLEQI